MKKTILSVCMTLLFLFVLQISLAKDHQPEVNREAKVIAAFEINSFCKAIMQGDIQTVKKLIELGEDVNRKSLGKTPAHFAARYNKPEILQLLIDNGANLKARCAKGYTVKKHAELSQANDALEIINRAMKK